MAVKDKKRQKLLDDAQPILHPGEVIEDISTGIMNASRFGGTEKRRGSLVVTDRRLIFFTKKLRGHEVHEFAYHLILSLQNKTGMMYGSVHLHAAGDQIEINTMDKAEVPRVTETIRKHMHQQAGVPAAVATNGTAPAPSLSDELAKLAQLRDQGVLTPEEFEAQKAKLLA